MNIITCEKGCCRLYILENKRKYMDNISYCNKKIKSGIFIYDPSSDKILIVQSNGNLWGSPKGTFSEQDKTFSDCAIRETKEETGLSINISQLSKMTMIKFNITYFYTEMAECPLFIQDHVDNNDATGIGWIKTDCLISLVNSGKIRVKHHFAVISWKFIKKYIGKK